MMVVLSSFLLILFTLSSCKENKKTSQEDKTDFKEDKIDSQEDDKPCPDFLHCEDFDNPYIDEMYIEALIEGDKFIPQSIRYCSTHNVEVKKRSNSKGIDNLKLRMYDSRNNIAFEKDIYLIKEEQDSGKRHVIIYLTDNLSTQHTIKIVELNEKKEELKVLAEIKTKDIPLVPLARQYKCEKHPFVLTSESNKAEDSL